VRNEEGETIEKEGEHQACVEGDRELGEIEVEQDAGVFTCIA
jgi:hypothetical protein